MKSFLLFTAFSALLSSPAYAAQIICGQNTQDLGGKGKNIADALNNLNDQLKSAHGTVSTITITYDQANAFAIACVSAQ